MCDVANALRNTSKGSLKYDREALKWPNIQKTIDETCNNTSVLSFSPLIISSLLSTSLSSEDDSFTTNRCRKTESIKKIELGTSPSGHTEILDSFPELQKYEENRQREVQEKIEMKQKAFREKQKLIKSKADCHLHVLNQEKNLRFMKQVEQLKQEQNNESRTILEKQRKMQEHSKQHLKLLNAKIKEAEMKQKLKEEEKKAEELIVQRRLSVIREGLLVTTNFLTQMKNKIESCLFKEKISDKTIHSIANIEQKKSKMAALLQLAENGAKSVDSDMRIAEETIAQLQSTLQVVISEVDEVNMKGEQELKNKLVNDLRAKEEAKKSAEKAAAKEKADRDEEGASLLTEYMMADSIENYVNLQDKLKEWQKTIQPFIDDASLKKYRFELQKTVNTTVNTIGKTSGAHLKDKLNKLHSLLSGGSVSIGNSNVKATNHQLSLHFCKELLAKKLVRQGEDQVASNHESAFAFAAVIVAIATNFPDVGDLILGHFHQRCPYLVPYYVPKQEGQSEQEHYKQLGYNYVDGVIEKQDKFLKRMSGIVRLYAAIVVSPLPPERLPGSQTKSNRHGLRYGWMWLTRVLNLEPRPDVTPTIIFNFLEVAGYAMTKTYGNQFKKCLHFICSEYFPKCKAVTANGISGPLQRLETLLQNTLGNHGNFAVPHGYLDSRFWSSYDS